MPTLLSPSLIRDLPALPLLLAAIACGPKRPELTREVAGTPPPVAARVEAPELVPTGAWYELRSAWGETALVDRPLIAWQHRLGGPVVHPLRSDLSRVFVVAAGELVTLDRTGAVLWTARIQASGPVGQTLDGVVVGTEDGPVAAYDSERGSLTAQYPGFGPVRGSPVPVGDNLAWVTVHGMVGGTGGWLVEAGYSAAGGGASDGERLYFTTLEGQVLAVTEAGKAWQGMLPGPGLGHPVVDGERVYAAYAASMGRAGGIGAFDRHTGAPLWSWSAEGSLGAPPALGRYLVVAAKDGTLSALEPETGEVVWQTPTSTELTATPAVMGQSVYAGGADGLVRRFDLDDGGEIWTVDVGAAVSGDPTMLGDMLIVGLADGRLVALQSPR